VRKVFVDTSGFYAAIDKSDPFHARAIELFARAEREKWELVTTNYVVHESWALIQKRIGWAALDEFLDVLVPICAVEYVTMDLHAAGSERCRASRRRLLSFTDCASFALMDQFGLKEAIATDDDFADAGFKLPAI
jgi:predicted nucleic acid-binding protein